MKNATLLLIVVAIFSVPCIDSSDWTLTGSDIANEFVLSARQNNPSGLHFCKQAMDAQTEASPTSRLHPIVYVFAMTGENILAYLSQYKR